ncbi:MAG: VCBS repeat-containing protein [Roseibacillus sp.]
MISWCSGVAACLGFALVSCSEKSADHDPPEGDPRPAASSAAAAFKVQSTQERLQFEERETELDPHNDGWASEAFHAETQDQLTILAAAMEAGELPNGILVSETESAAGALRPCSLSAVFESNGLRVLRSRKSALETAKPGTSLREELQHLVESLHEGETEVSVRFKQFQVSPPKAGQLESSSTVLYKAKSSTSTADRVQNATWEIAWILSEEEEAFLIRGIRLREFEEIELAKSAEAEAAGNDLLFRDRTEDLIGAMPRAGGLISYGANELGMHTLYESGRSLIGIAIGDANGDGLDDIYAPQAKDLPNLFLLSQPDGSHREVAAEAGIDWLDYTAVALFADFDNDGDQDLVIATRSLLVIHSNDGTGRNFTRIAEWPQPDVSSLCAADYDGDGLLDLFVCNYLDSSESETVALADAIYDGKQGGMNLLYRNTGGLKFVDVTKETGIDAEATRMSLAASWEDFDNDGDPDLYVANDFGPNCLYRNEGGMFTEIAAEAGADDPSTGMSITWGDIDRDGFMDACIGNMFSAAGNRVTSQAKFKEDLTKGLDAERIRYLARGNTLLMSKGAQRFDERSAQAGILNTQWTWGTLFGDFDNNGDLDMMAMNGFITGPVVDDL